MDAEAAKRERIAQQPPPAGRRWRTSSWWAWLAVVSVTGAAILVWRSAQRNPLDLVDVRPSSPADLAASPTPGRVWGPAYGPQATAEELLKEARQVAELVAARYPDQPAALAVLARLHYALGESQESAEVWQRAVSLDPACAEGHFGCGAVALRRGEFAKAVEALERVAALTPGDPRVPAALAAAWLGIGRVEEAVSTLELAAKVGDLSTDATVVLGQGYLQQEKYDQALPLFEQLVRQAPQEPKAYYGLARACLKRGRLEEARQHMQRFQEFQKLRVEEEHRVAHAFSDPRTSRGRLVQTLLEAAAVYAQAGDARQAERHWQSVAHLEPQHIASRRQLWRLYQAQERSREALAVGEQLCELEPASGEHWFNVALLRGCLQDYDTAIAAANRAIELEPQNARYRQARDVLREGQGL